MARRFLFITKMKPTDMSVLEALAKSGRVTCTATIVVCTELAEVAALLDQLDTAEELGIDAQPPAPVTVAVTPEAAPTKPRKVRKVQTGELIECSRCHEKKVSGNMTKAGICKTCRMLETRVKNGQMVSKMHSALPPKPDYGHQENLANLQAKPKEVIQLAGLRGRKLG